MKIFLFSPVIDLLLAMSLVAVVFWLAAKGLRQEYKNELATPRKNVSPKETQSPQTIKNCFLAR